MSIAGKKFDRLESLDELHDAIEMGLDIEFILYGERYNISWREDKPFICTCPDGDAVFFEDTEDLLNRYEADGKVLKDIWEDMEILAM